MKKEQLSDRIGNIDDRLIQHAEQVPDYRRQHRQKGLRRLISLAAVSALMACSFSVGAWAFSKETVVEVPTQQETIVLDQLGLTLVLPQEWKGQYGVEMYEDGSGCSVYVKAVHDGDGPWAGQGYLFWIGNASYCQTHLTPGEVQGKVPIPCIYLFSTAETTYILGMSSDVQYDPSDPEQAQLYQTMYQQIQDIVFQIDNPAVIDPN